jgi:hypothetical protein
VNTIMEFRVSPCAVIQPSVCRPKGWDAHTGSADRWLLWSGLDRVETYRRFYPQSLTIHHALYLRVASDRKIV